MAFTETYVKVDSAAWDTDTVYAPDDQVVGTDDNNYYCILAQDADQDAQPTTGADYATYWAEADGTSEVKAWNFGQMIAATESGRLVPDGGCGRGARGRVECGTVDSVLRQLHRGDMMLPSVLMLLDWAASGVSEVAPRGKSYRTHNEPPCYRATSTPPTYRTENEPPCYKVRSHDD